MLFIIEEAKKAISEFLQAAVKVLELCFLFNIIPM